MTLRIVLKKLNNQWHGELYQDRVLLSVEQSQYRSELIRLLEKLGTSYLALTQHRGAPTFKVEEGV